MKRDHRGCVFAATSLSSPAEGATADTHPLPAPGLQTAPAILVHIENRFCTWCGDPLDEGELVYDAHARKAFCSSTCFVRERR